MGALREFGAQWEFTREIGLFLVLALLAVVPVAMLIEASFGITYSDASRRLRGFLEDWASFPGETVWKVVFRGVASVGGAVLLLALFAWVLNRLGDVTLPHVSKVFHHFGKKRVAWSLDHEGEWDGLRHGFRETTGIRNDLIKYEKVKARLGSYEYRFYRTLFWLGLLTVAAGIVNWSRKAGWRKVAFELSLGLFVALISVAIWADREDRFIRNMVSEYRDAYKQKTGSEPPLPAHYPQSEGQQGQRRRSTFQRNP